MSSSTIISLRPENVIRRLPWQLDSKTALGFLLILAIFSLVGWLYLTQASAVTTTSYRIDKLRLELDQVKNQNAALTLEIAQLEALSRVETRAHELGFEPVTDVRYLSIADYPLSSSAEARKTAHAEGKKVSTSTEAKPSNWADILDNFVAWVAGK